MTENPSFVLWVVSESNLPRQAQTGTLRELRKTEIALRADGALTAILAPGIEPIALRNQSRAMTSRVKLALEPCTVCNDTGTLLVNDCEVIACECCERYADDLEAARAFIEANNGWKLDRVLVRARLESE